MASTIERQLIVFDFDWSLADQDSDRWVLEVLAPDLRRKMKSQRETVQWTDLVAQGLRDLHARGFKREQIEGALWIMPFHPAMIRAVEKLKEDTSPSTKFFCLSNANEIYIKTILQSKGLENLFDEIVTNPAKWEDNGLLNLRRRIDPAGLQHECKVGCSPNMCKGEELDAFLKRNLPAFDRVIYVGDGSNDFCPVLRLRSQDLVFCRRFRGLEGKIASRPEDVKAQVKYWVGAWEVEEFLAEPVAASS